MPKGDARFKKLEEQVINFENRVQKIEGVFQLGSNILSDPYIPSDPFSLADIEPLYDKAVKIVRQYDRASASLLQRRLAIGYARAVRLLDLLEKKQVVSPAEGREPRIVLPEKKKNSKKK